MISAFFSSQFRVRLISLVFLTIILSAIGFSQLRDIRGIVADSSTNEKLPYVNVVIHSLNKGGTTNTNGFYLIAGLASGTYEVSASCIGYRKKTVSVYVGSQNSITLNFKLVSESININEVVVESERNKIQEDFQSSLRVLTPKDLENIPVAVQGDIFRAIQVMPGIISTSDVNSKFYVRGGAGDQNLILLDGIKIYNPFHAFGVFSIFDPDIIQTSEIYTGAYPPGFHNRLSSVINISTRSGNSSRVSGNGSVDLISAKAQVEGPLGVGKSAIVHFRKSLFEKSFSRFIKNNTPISFYDGFAKITIEDDEYTRFTAQAFISGDDLYARNNTDVNYQWKNSVYSLSLSSLLSERLYINFLAHSSEFITRRVPESEAFLLPASSKIHEIGLKAYFTAYSEDAAVYSFGFEFNIPDFENSLRNSFDIPVQVSNAAIELSMWLRYQQKYEFVSIDAGVDVDAVSLLDNSPLLDGIQPRITLTTPLSNLWNFKVAYGHFIQNSFTLNNEEDVISLFEPWTAVPAGMKPSSSNHYNIGIDGYLSSATKISLAGYYKTYESLVLYNRNKAIATDPDYLPGIGDSYGVEFFWQSKNSWVDFLAGYTLGWTTVEVDGFRYSPRYDRRHSVNLAGTFRLFDGMEASFRWEIGSGLPYTQTTGYYDRLVIADPIRGTFQNENGKPIATLGPKNAARMPLYHRLDMSANYTIELDPIVLKAGITIVNTYDQKNIMYVDRYSGQKVYMLPFFPSANLRVEF